MIHRSRIAVPALLLLGAIPVRAAAPIPPDVRATVTGLRSAKGQVLACLTRDPRTFPECDKDPDAQRLIVPAAKVLELDFGAVAPGRYALSLIHDENGNGKLDKALIIPREGFGFSRDAPVRMGPPRFEAAAFTVGPGTTQITVRMRYLL